MNRKLSKGLEAYYEFHQLDPRNIDRLSAKMPKFVTMVGYANWITYRSGKWGKGTYDYIHDFGPGVRVATVEKIENAPVRKLPKRVHQYEYLFSLGKFLGFNVTDHYGEEIEAKGTRPLPELCCSHDGRTLFVIEDKKRISAVIWGGKMKVEARGIVN